MYSSGRPAVVAAEKEVKVMAKGYLKAVEMSLKMAGYGFTFAGDAVRLCECLSRDPNTDVLKFIDELQKIAHRALREANGTHKKFRAVGRALLQVCIGDTITIAAVD
jgi:hypothetical protein